MRKKVTLKQIAKELDVSVSTVSKSLKDSPEISEDTRLKVQAFAKLYNYKPNNIALSLKNRRTKTIAVIIPEIVHHFFATVITGVEQVANDEGYNVLVCLSNESFTKEVINMETLASGSIDGFIMSLSKETQQKQDFHHIKEAISQGMPVVLFDRVTNKINTDKVIIDDFMAAYNAVQFLLNTGAKKIALITTVDYVSVGKLRTDGYKKALIDNGIAVEDKYIVKIEDMDTCDTKIHYLMSTEKIDAIFAVNELFAVVAIKIANSLQIKIPNDLEIIAFTDGIISKFSTPTITTVSQSGVKMGRKAAQILIKKLEDENEEQENEVEVYDTVEIETELILRETTKTL
ncbi:LacI family DNA-binding transcriptional regulator [Flavobacterium sp.]|uniref:LacI family DNA-binding transcriptional regulator n=1 Tax=Flavobacterium sp. TaxID=239 RepID=UPI003527AD2B